MESLTTHFERHMAAFVRRVRMSAAEFGERAVGGRSFLDEVRRCRSPRLAAADRVLAFMEAFGRSRESDGSRDSSISEGGTNG